MKDVNFPQAPIFSLATSPDQVPPLPQFNGLLSPRKVSHAKERNSSLMPQFKKRERSLNSGKRTRERDLRTALVAVSSTLGCYEAFMN